MSGFRHDTHTNWVFTRIIQMIKLHLQRAISDFYRLRSIRMGQKKPLYAVAIFLRNALDV